MSVLGSAHRRFSHCTCPSVCHLFCPSAAGQPAASSTPALSCKVTCVPSLKDLIAETKSVRLLLALLTLLTLSSHKNSDSVLLSLLTVRRTVMSRLRPSEGPAPVSDRDTCPTECRILIKINRLYAVSASKIPSTKFCEGFWDFVAVSSPTGPPFHELSTNSLGFYEGHAPSTTLVEYRFLQNPFCALPFRLPLKNIDGSVWCH